MFRLSHFNQIAQLSITTKRMLIGSSLLTPTENTLDWSFPRWIEISELNLCDLATGSPAQASVSWVM